MLVKAIMSDTYIQMKRSKQAEELMKDPAAYILLTQIAYRARRTNEFNVNNLKVGEALIGDYKSIGLTEQKYRTAKGHLKQWGFATFQSTNKGTIAKLINSEIYNINPEGDNEQLNRPATIKQRTDNERVTTNKNVKNEKNKTYTEDFENWYSVYPKHEGKQPAFKSWVKINPDKELQETLLKSIKEQIKFKKWNKSNYQYIPQPATWLNGKRWEDETTQDSQPKKTYPEITS